MMFSTTKAGREAAAKALGPGVSAYVLDWVESGFIGDLPENFHRLIRDAVEHDRLAALEAREG